MKLRLVPGFRKYKLFQWFTSFSFCDIIDISDTNDTKLRQSTTKKQGKICPLGFCSREYLNWRSQHLERPPAKCGKKRCGKRYPLGFNSRGYLKWKPNQLERSLAWSTWEDHNPDRDVPHL